MDNLPHFYAKDRNEWRKWLKDHHATDVSVWLIYDKGSDRKLTWSDIVKEALCFGWIDSRPGKVSDTQSKLYITKRKPKSVWSKINKGYVAELVAEGLMQPAGQSAIDEAKRNGSWDALNLSDDLIYSPELIEKFKVSPLAKQNFEKFSASSRRRVLQWLYDAKTEKTRENRLQQVIENSEKNVRIY